MIEIKLIKIIAGKELCEEYEKQYESIKELEKK